MNSKSQSLCKTETQVTTWDHANETFTTQGKTQDQVRDATFVATFSWNFFFLQCRTSTRHGRSTTGKCKDCFRKSPWKQNPRQKQHPHNQTNTKTTQKTNTHTKAKRQPGNTTWEICKLGETRWNKSAPLSPSYALFRHVVIRHVVLV